MQIHSVSSTISKTGLNNAWWTCFIFVWITFHYRTLEPHLVTTSAYIFWVMFLWDKFIIEIELHLFSRGCNSWLLHVSCDTLARASAFRVFLTVCLFAFMACAASSLLLVFWRSTTQFLWHVLGSISSFGSLVFLVPRCFVIDIASLHCTHFWFIHTLSVYL